jgi:hypothetical protein
MTVLSITRREVLAGATACTGAAMTSHWASAGTPPAEATLGPSTAAPSGKIVAGKIVAWVVVTPERGATIRLAYVLSPGEIVETAPILLAAEALTGGAPSASAWRQAQVAAERAQAAALTLIANVWKVSPAECACEVARIAHARSGRSVGYAVWVDVA